MSKDYTIENLKIVQGHAGTWFVDATMSKEYKGFNPQAVYIADSREKCEKFIKHVVKNDDRAKHLQS